MRANPVFRHPGQVVRRQRAQLRWQQFVGKHDRTRRHAGHPHHCTEPRHDHVHNHVHDDHDHSHSHDDSSHSPHDDHDHAHDHHGHDHHGHGHGAHDHGALRVIGEYPADFGHGADGGGNFLKFLEGGRIGDVKHLDYVVFKVAALGDVVLGDEGRLARRADPARATRRARDAPHG